MLLSYWLFLSGVVFVAGSFTSRVFVTGPSGADICLAGERKRCFGEIATRHIFAISLFTLIVNGVHLILHASVMTETPLNETFSIIPVFLEKTKYGRLAVLRSVFLFGIIVLAFLALRKERRWVKISGVVCSFFLLLVISMSGHQGAKGYANIPFFLDVFHIIAVSLWIGGLFFLRFSFSFFLKEAGAELWDTCCSLINRFSRLATYCVFIAGVSGGVLAVFNIKSFSVVLTTQYGLVLLVKAILVGGIMLLGGINKYVIIPLMNMTEKEKWTELTKLRRRLFSLLTFEVYIGLAVLFLTSLLTHLSPEG